MSHEDSIAVDQELPVWMERTAQLLGEDKCNRLQHAHVLVAGLGGVGSVAAEMLARAGIGELTIVDNDHVQPSNINRQLPALHSTIGESKTDIVAGRLKDINPALKLHLKKVYINDATLEEILNGDYNYILDAIDTLTPKITLIEEALKKGFRLTSSMGSGGKTDPSKIAIEDFGKTYNCRLAYILRKKLRKKGVSSGFKVVFSTELIDKSLLKESSNEPNKKSITGTVSYIPAIFGCMLASVIIRDLSE